MIIFLYGPDTYRSKQKLNEIVERYRDIHKSGMSFKDFDCQDKPFEDFRDTLSVVSMFDSKKLFVLREATRSKDFSGAFLEWKGKNSLRNSKDSICVFFDDEVNKQSHVFEWLRKNAQSQEFGLLSGKALRDWAENYIKQGSILIDGDALGELLLHTGGDLWLLTNELKKFNSYVAGTKITKEHLRVFLRPNLSSHIFSFLDSLALGDRSRAFKFLRGGIEAGDSEGYIFYMLHSQFRNIAIAQSFSRGGAYDVAKISREARMHPFVAQKSVSFARTLKKEKIKIIYKKLVDLDRDIKTGKMLAREALETFILEL